jgi:hypothetical protein
MERKLSGANIKFSVQSTSLFSNKVRTTYIIIIEINIVNPTKPVVLEFFNKVEIINEIQQHVNPYITKIGNVIVQ